MDTLDAGGRRPRIKIRDLLPIHDPATSGRRPEFEQLTDAELLDAVVRPQREDYVKISTRTGRLVDGNGRAYELLHRAADPASAITPETEIPYEPHPRGRIPGP